MEGVNNGRYIRNKSSPKRKGVPKSRKRNTDTKLKSVQDQESGISDCESSSSSFNRVPNKVGLSNDGGGLVRLREEDNTYNVIKKAFLVGMGEHRSQTSIVSIQKNSFSDSLGEARLRAFGVYSEMTANKVRNGARNVSYAWYGSSKDKIDRIIAHGFDASAALENNGLYGSGIYLSPHNSSLGGVMTLTDDKDGVRHALLCRVNLGNVEEVPQGTNQCHPSSKIYDNGVDNLLAPKKYIIWTTNMNTHILPEYLVSFKVTTCLKGIQVPVDLQEPFGVPPFSMKPPTSPWIAIPTLLSILSKFLRPDIINLVEKYHCEYREKKLSRGQLIHHMRQVVGDRLLISVIKSYRAKLLREGTVLPESSN